MTRPLLLTLITLAGGAVATGMIVARPAPDTGRAAKKSPAKASKTRAAKPVDTLVAQLHRRFTDTRDVDFGFSRVSRPKERSHYGPIMERNNLVWDADSEGEIVNGFDPRFIRDKEDSYELKAEDGTWIPWDNVRAQMRPENAVERDAIATLLNSRREIAIYTFGSFLDGKAQRARGPAYLRQKGPKAPDAERIKDLANRAWKGGLPNLPGFALRVEKVFAKKSCVKCHNEMRGGDGEGQQPFSDTYKKGDPLGIILIAEKL